MKAHKISWWRTTFSNGEAAAITRAIANEHVSQGPLVAEFERQLASYLEVPYIVATTSGSTALLMGMMAAGVGPGDEVIVPNRTWIATAHAPLLLGAKVKLVDVEPDRPIIDAHLIEAAITARTKAIVPVHMGGRSADMRAINQIAQRHNLAVIEDAAQALGSRNVDGLLGTQSTMGCFSLSVAKIIATGQGGFIATRDDAVHRKLVAIRTQGVGDVVNAAWEQPGFNFRFTDILAAIGIEQLKLLDDRIKAVNAIYQCYANGLRDNPHVRLIPVDVSAGEVPVYVEARSPVRDELVAWLGERGIQCRPFYPGLHHAPYLNATGGFPNAEPIGEEGLYLPCGPTQPLENVHAVVSSILDFEPSL